MADNDLPKLLQTLLHNAYRAFQLRSEEAVYDRLAKSLDEPLLESIYLQQRRSRIQQAKGLGGEGHVERIEVLEAKRMNSPDGGWRPLFSAAGANEKGHEIGVDARWKAIGVVSHWGHSHQRDNLYRARLTLRREAAGNWKIASMSFADGQRLDVAASR